MNILLVSPLPPPIGGIAIWTEKFLADAVPYGISPTVIDTAVIGTRALAPDGKIRLTDELRRFFRVRRQIRRAIRSRKPDAVHLCSSCSPFGVIKDRLFMRACGKVPVFLHCHCNIADQLGERKFARRAFAKMARRAACVFTLNESSRRYAAQIDGAKAVTVPNFIDGEALSSSVTVREEITNVLFVGHVIPTKGVSELLEVACRFPKVTFTLAGPVAEVYRDITENYPNVKFLGSQDHKQVEALLATHDVFLFPSYTEGFSVALLEAMAAGLPCVATDVGANRDMIEDKGGVIVPVKDVTALEAALKALAPREVRENMAGWNIRKVETNYTTAAVMRQIADLYATCEKRDKASIGNTDI